MSWENDNYCDWEYGNVPYIKDRLDPPDEPLPDPVVEDLEDVIDCLHFLNADDEWDREEMKEITAIIYAWFKERNKVREMYGKRIWKI